MGLAGKWLRGGLGEAQEGPDLHWEGCGCWPDHCCHCWKRRHLILLSMVVFEMASRPGCLLQKLSEVSCCTQREASFSQQKLLLVIVPVIGPVGGQELARFRTVVLKLLSIGTHSFERPCAWDPPEVMLWPDMPSLSRSRSLLLS